MKKLFNIVLISVLLMVSISIPQETVYGKTLGNLKEELATLIEEREKAVEEKKLTEAEMAAINGQIQQSMEDIEEIGLNMVKLKAEIEQLQKDIIQKDKEMKEVVSFYQTSSSETFYLEYAFGAEEFTDFIYRLAVSEQLLQYNDNLIKSYNEMIIENNEKTKELQEEEKNVVKKQQELNVRLDSLGGQLNDIVDLRVDIDEEIKTLKEAVDLYQNQFECKDNEEIDQCTLNKLPIGTEFYRPLKTGHKTSDYGYRTYTLNKKTVSDFHSGIDLSTYDNGNVPVYASATGVVIAIVYKSSCGGNKIYVHHNINGKKYTTSYVHLRSILVRQGQTVTAYDQIGVMGGNPYRETWDKCSTGAHLHFSVANGLYLKEYSSWNTYISKTINPRLVVNFPSGSGTFYDRITKY